MSVVKIEQRGVWVFTTDIVISIFISNILIAHLCNIMQANKNVCVAFSEGLHVILMIVNLVKHLL